MNVLYTDGQTIFISIVLSLYAFALTVFLTAPHFPIILIPFIFLFYWYCFSKIFMFCERLNLTSRSSDEEKINAWFVSFFVFVLYVLMLCITGVEHSADTIVQWNEVITGHFSDWHPVIHTFSIYIFSKILPQEWFVIVCFIAIFSLLCGWLVKTLQMFLFKRKIVFFILAFLVFSPCSMFASRTLWKDSEFALAILYLSIAMINLWYSNGEWILRWKHLIPSVIVLVYAAFVRHNGIFFVVPFLIFLPFISKIRAVRLRLFLFSCVGFLCLSGYVVFRTYLITENIITSNKHQIFSESVGLPMSMLSEAFVYHQEKIPHDAKNFLLKIATYEKWKQCYDRDFNSVKFETQPQSTSVFSEISPKEFFTLFIKTVIACPKACITSFRRVSSLGWDPFLRTKVRLGHTDFAFLQEFMHKLGISWIFFSPGFYVLLLIIFGTYSYLKTGLRALFMFVPFVVYSYGTALLLTGFDHRFFFAIIIASPCIVLTLIDSNRIYEKHTITGEKL